MSNTKQCLSCDHSKNCGKYMVILCKNKRSMVYYDDICIDYQNDNKRLTDEELENLPF